MPFRSLSFIWSLVVWTEVFAYTILTQSESVPLICSIPIVALFVTIVAFVAFVQQESMRMKSLILFALWGCIITIVLLLRTWSLVDDTFLNLYIAVTGLLTSIVWCIISHSARITEAAWHWYIWSNILIIAVCGAFNHQTNTAEKYYILNTVCLLVVQVVYIWFILHRQPSGTVRCRHLWRVAAGTLVSITLSVTSILQRSEVLTSEQWQESIVVIEIILGVCVVIDAVIGFRQQPINYLPLDVDNNAL